MSSPGEGLLEEQHISLLRSRWDRVFIRIELHDPSHIREQLVLNWSVSFLVPIVCNVSFQFSHLMKQQSQNHLWDDAKYLWETSKSYVWSMIIQIQLASHIHKKGSAQNLNNGWTRNYNIMVLGLTSNVGFPCKLNCVKNSYTLKRFHHLISTYFLWSKHVTTREN